MDPVLEHGLVAAMKDEIGGGIFGTHAEAAKMSPAAEALGVNSILEQFYKRCSAPRSSESGAEESGRGGGFRFYFANPQYFVSKFDHDFTSIKVDDNVYDRGGKPYQRPLGAKRYAIKVLGQYDDDKWLGEPGPRTRSSLDEWPVAYHGTKESCSGAIVSKGFDLSKGQRFKYGEGIYCTPNPNVALKYSRGYNFEGHRYRLVFQTRVDPAVLQVVEVRGADGQAEEYWRVPNGNHIRPYGVCVYAMKSAAN